MKFRHTIDGHTVKVVMSGDLDSRECACLQAFWDCHIGENHAAVDIDLAAVDTIDAESIAVLTTLIRSQLALGTEVTLHRAPQMLAHTLYKIGLLDHSGLTLIEPRSDEQHAT
jgi:ABC-type transporter Mla MlaB component